MADITSGIWARWTLDADGTDTGPNNFTLSLYGTPGLVSGNIGGAMSFDGSTQYGQYVTSYLAVPMTISCWVKCTAARNILPLGTWGAAWTGCYLYVDTAGVVYGGFTNGGDFVGGVASSSGLFPFDNNWHLISMTLISTSDRKLSMASVGNPLAKT